MTPQSHYPQHEVQLSAMQRELHRVADLMARNNVLGQQLEAATSIAAQLRVGARLCAFLCVTGRVLRDCGASYGCWRRRAACKRRALFVEVSALTSPHLNFFVLRSALGPC